MRGDKAADLNGSDGPSAPARVEGLAASPIGPKKVLRVLGWLLVVCGCFAATRKFPAIHEYGPRELGHLLGFAGMYLVSEGLPNLVKPRGLKIPQLRWLFGTVGWLASIFLLDSFRVIDHAYATVAFVGLPVLFAAILCQPFLSSLARTYPKSARAGWFLLLTWGWELVIQRFFTANDAGPGGFVEWPQVVSDIAGITLGALLAHCLSRVAAARTQRS